MGKITEWESEYEGKVYNFSHEKIKGVHSLKINGEVVEIKPGMKSAFLGFDEPFQFEGKEARLVIEDKKPDIAVDGKYLGSGNQYISTPKWLIIFVIILFPLIILGGAIGGVTMVIGSLVCKKISRLDKSNALRLVLCTVASLGSWLLWFIIAAIITG